MKLTLAQMEAFLWTARLGSTTAAAQRLGLTQPSVSLRLHDLRRVTGTEPFHRTAAGLRLTSEGRHLLGQVTAVLDLTRAMAGTEGLEPAGSIRLGFAEGFAMVHLPHLLPALRDRFPHLRPELTVSTSRELEDLLVQGRLDLAVISDPIGEGLRSMPLGMQRIVWIAGPGWDLPKAVTPSTMEHLPIMVNPPGSPMHRRMAAWFNAAALQPSNVSYCSSGAAIQHLVAAGVAASLAPERMVLSQQSTCRVQMLTAEPEVRAGQLFVCEREGPSSAIGHAIAGLVASVMSSPD